MRRLAELIDRKTKGEQASLTDADVSFHEREYERLRVELQEARDQCHLPDRPGDKTRAALNELLVRVRLAGR